MNAYRLNIELDFKADVEIDLERLIPIFHRWIQDRRLDEILIDVADYRHVPNGPGVMLIGHQANYGVTLARLRRDVALAHIEPDAETVGGRFSLVYARKRPAAGGFADLLRDALDRALGACLALEQESTLDGLTIPGDRWTLRIHDRLLAPNDDQTHQAVEPELRRLLGQLYEGGNVELRGEDDPAECFALSVAANEAPGVGVLRERLAATSGASVPPQLAGTELHLPPELRAELARRATRGYPREACGLLIGRPGARRTEVQRLFEARNLERSRPGDRYRLDPDDFVAADNAARLDGLDVVGIWHSHPDCPARPSTTDLAAAWPDYSYLIVGVTGAGEHDVHSWRFDGTRFAEEQILPDDPRSSAAVFHFHNPLKEERTT